MNGTSTPFNKDMSKIGRMTVFTILPSQCSRYFCATNELTRHGRHRLGMSLQIILQKGKHHSQLYTLVSARCRAGHRLKVLKRTHLHMLAWLQPQSARFRHQLAMNYPVAKTLGLEQWGELTKSVIGPTARTNINMYVVKNMDHLLKCCFLVSPRLSQACWQET